jgi:phosphoribosylformylglycinamidine synthase
VGNVAGVCNETFNVFGLMPHPERACEDLLGYYDGLLLWYSLISA